MNNLISYSAIKTIIYFEIRDFFKEYQFNIIAPLINTVLFVIIFSSIEKYYSFNNSDYNYINFLIPGMIMIVVIQTSFNHLSEVLISMKQSGSFNDYLISPISRVEIFFSFLISSFFVCMIVGIINIFTLSFFSSFQTINYLNIFYYLGLTIIIFSSIGAIVGLLSFTWDVQSSVSHFIILPICFLSGTFFSIDSLDKNWHFLFKFNPFYYLIKGFRSSFIDNYRLSFYNELYIFILFILILTFSIYVFKKGYKVIN